MDYEELMGWLESIDPEVGLLSLYDTWDGERVTKVQLKVRQLARELRREHYLFPKEELCHSSMTSRSG
jgi:hypothetical protein